MIETSKIKRLSRLVFDHIRLYTLFYYFTILKYLEWPNWKRTNPFKIIWIDPDEIQYLTGRSNAGANRWLNSGKTRNGTWDQSRQKFSKESIWYQALYARYVEGQNWQEIALIQDRIRRVEAGETLWHGCSSKEDILNRCERLDDIYQSIDHNGYQSQKEMLNQRDTQIRLSKKLLLKQRIDEIAVDISRDGAFLFVDGRHRLSIAKLLDIESIPVRVVIRHEHWQNFRREIASYIDNNSNNQLFHELPHPDLREFPTRYDSKKWYDIIEDISVSDNGTLLELTPEISGYFCNKIDSYDCYALQENAKQERLLRKTRTISGADYQIMKQEELVFTSFDVVVATGIFHHRMKTQKYLEILNDLDIKELYFDGMPTDCVKVAMSLENGPDAYYFDKIIDVGGNSSLYRATKIR